MIECLHASLCPCAWPTLVLDPTALLACDERDPVDRGRHVRALDPTLFRRDLYDSVVLKSALDRTKLWLAMGAAGSTYLRSLRVG